MRVTPQMYLDAKEDNDGKENNGKWCHTRIHHPPHTHSRVSLLVSHNLKPLSLSHCYAHTLRLSLCCHK